MIYLTFNDAPTGIYYSQVTDVCSFFTDKLRTQIKLVAFISVRYFWSNRAKIRSNFSNAIVVPMFPGVYNWKMNYVALFILSLFIDTKRIISRGPFATLLSLQLKRSGRTQQVCFDGRGAYDAEFNEYEMVKNEAFRKNIFQFEKDAIVNSDFRIAVSHQLVSYWKERYNYQRQDHVVIPCTYHSSLFTTSDQDKIKEIKRSLGIKEEDILFVFSGSDAGWQSLSNHDVFLCSLLKSNPLAKLLILSKSSLAKMNVVKEYGDRIIIKWVEVNDVPDLLNCCDYGLLLRSASVTNKVSSPVKFAEYLASGLKVIISEHIGDYSEFVQKNDCGSVVSDNAKPIDFQKPLPGDKERMRSLAVQFFSKDSQIDKYKSILSKFNS